VSDVRIGGEVECLSELRCDAQHIRHRSLTVRAHDAIDRFGAHEILGEVRLDTGDPGRDRRGDGRVREIRVNQRLQLSDQAMNAVGRQVEPEEFDRDELVLLRIVGTENRS